MHIFLNPTHRDVATYNEQTGSTEDAVTAGITERTVRLLEKRGHTVTVFEDPAEEVICQRVKESGADIFISLRCHSDASPASLGSEVLCYPESHAGLLLAKCTMRHLVHHVNLISRGVKWAIPGQNEIYILSHLGKMPAIYVNLGFITNKHDEKLLTTCQDEYSRSLLYAIVAYQKYYK